MSTISAPAEVTAGTWLWLVASSWLSTSGSAAIRPSTKHWGGCGPAAGHARRWHRWREKHGLNHGLSYGLANFAWAGGQAIAAVASGALADATFDTVPYGLLAFACLGTIALVQVSGRGTAPMPDT